MFWGILLADFLCLALELFEDDLGLDLLGLDLERDEGWLEGWERFEWDW
jgi:hypothetical protein